MGTHKWGRAPSPYLLGSSGVLSACPPPPLSPRTRGQQTRAQIACSFLVGSKTLISISSEIATDTLATVAFSSLTLSDLCATHERALSLLHQAHAWLCSSNKHTQQQIHAHGNRVLDDEAFHFASRFSTCICA